MNQVAPRHALVIFDGSTAARRALAEAAALTAEHDAALTVIALVVHERQAVGCCVPAATWNRELDVIVDGQLSEARAILASRGRSAHFGAVEGDGARAVHRTAEALGCDVVLVPAHGLLPDRLARDCRRAGCARVIAVRAQCHAPASADEPSAVPSTTNRIATRQVKRCMSAHATFNGQTIAESDHTIVVEGNHYFPVEDVRDELLRATSSRTLCPWKGVANYWTVEVGGVRAKNAAWGYRRPWPLARRVKGRIAFYNGVAVHAD